MLVNGQPGSPDSVAEAGALLRLGCLLALRCSASASLAPGSGQGSRAARTPFKIGSEPQSLDSWSLNFIKILALLTRPSLRKPVIQENDRFSFMLPKKRIKSVWK